MATTINHPPERLTLFTFLRQELAPRPGRMRAVWRITAGSTLIVVLGMVFQIPIPAYMAYIVFLVAREEMAASVMTGVAGLVAATLAVALSILFYMLDADEPGLRLPLLALSTFIAMFFARTSSLGPIAFLAGFVLVMSQTLIDDFPTTEYLLRFLLWLWVVVALPAFVTVLIDLIWGENPVRMVRTRANDLLRQTAAILEGQSDADPAELREMAVDTMAIHEHARMWDKKLKAKTAVDLQMFEGLVTILSLLCLLPKDTVLAARLPVAQAIEACRIALKSGTVPAHVGAASAANPRQRATLTQASLAAEAAPTRARECVVDESVLAGLDSSVRPVVLALVRTANELLKAASERPDAVAPAAAPKRLFVPDAFSNRAHMHFALKTALAVTLSYIIYSLLDWSGIRTAITTCFFVALGSMAETMHKLSLRLTGAIVGGTVAGFSIVYLLPTMDDIGGLALLIAAVSVLCAWVATSSERLAYAGMQMAFAFYLGLLDDYAPTTDLTGLRDRVVGILLGNILMSMIFSVIWPVSALQVIRASMSKALGLMGKLVSEATRENRPLRLSVVQELVRSRKLASLSLFERGFMADRISVSEPGPLTLAELDRVASATFVVQSQGSETAGGVGFADERDHSVRWLSETATQTREGLPPPPWNPAPPVGEGAASVPGIQQEAMACLQSEIADVAPAR